MKLTTESINPSSAMLDRLSSLELVRLINAEDAGIAQAVAREEDKIAAAVDTITNSLKAGGRLVYIGAGTSGRLGVLDASECPPTFNADPGQVIGLIAGGPDAIVQAVEGAEDSEEQGPADLQAIDFCKKDVLVGITASGATPYVLAALDYARSVKAATIAITCNRAAKIEQYADLTIAIVVGAEVLAGSTRMKAGTGTKMVLNMLTTSAMVKLGKTYANLMVDLQASNEKLIRRSVGLVRQLTSLEDEDAQRLLQRCDGELKTAIVCELLGIDTEAARARLAAVSGRLRLALKSDE